MKSKRICVLGNASIETKIFIHKFPPKNGETTINYIYKTVGGSGACSATFLNRLGFEVSIITQVGVGTEGDEILSTLEKVGVDITRVIRRNSSTIFYSVFDRSFNRNIFIKNPQWDEEVILSHLYKSLGDAEILILCPTTVSLFTSALEMGKNMGKTLVTLPQFAFNERSSDIITKIFQLSDRLFLNEAEVYRYTHTNSLRATINCLKPNKDQIVVITRGAKGCVVISHKEVIEQPGIKGDVIDPSAAGDSFMAGFISALEQDKDLKKAAHIGCTISFVVCKAPGLIEKAFSIDGYLKNAGYTEIANKKLKKS